MWTHLQPTSWYEGRETHSRSSSKSIIRIWRASLRASTTLSNKLALAGATKHQLRSPEKPDGVRATALGDARYFFLSSPRVRYDKSMTIFLCFLHVAKNKKLKVGGAGRNRTDA